MKDFRGREIRADDTIVYTSRRGSTLFLREAVVYYTFPGCACCQRTDTGRTVTLRHPEYVAIVGAEQCN